MRFKGSAWEDKLNRFWNDEVVANYTRLLTSFDTIGFFRTDYKASKELLKRYRNNVINVVNNFDRIQNNYSDKRYLTNYLQATQTSSLNDLEQFKGLFLSYFHEDVSEAIGLIDELSIKLGKKPPQEKVEIKDDNKSEAGEFHM